MTTRSTIREAMRGHGPLSAGAVCDLLGATTRKDRLTICQQLGSMTREGVVTKTGQRMQSKYAIAREPVVRVKLSPEERVRRRQERERKRYARRHKAAGGMTFAEYHAKRAAARAERLAAKQAERLARPKPEPKPKPSRTTAYAEEGRKRLRAHMAKKAGRPKEQQPSIAKVFQAPAVAPERMETVEEWMARTGAKPERVLAHWEVAHA